MGGGWSDVFAYVSIRDAYLPGSKDTSIGPIFRKNVTRSNLGNLEAAARNLLATECSFDDLSSPSSLLSFAIVCYLPFFLHLSLSFSLSFLLSLSFFLAFSVSHVSLASFSSPWPFLLPSLVFPLSCSFYISRPSLLIELNQR